MKVRMHTEKETEDWNMVWVILKRIFPKKRESHQNKKKLKMISSQKKKYQRKKLRSKARLTDAANAAWLEEEVTQGLSSELKKL